jgi:hypothetical protein
MCLSGPAKTSALRAPLARGATAHDIELPEAIYAMRHCAPEELDQGLLLAAAAQRYRQGRIFEERAVTVAGMDRREVTTSVKYRCGMNRHGNVIAGRPCLRRLGKGVAELQPSAYSDAVKEPPANYRVSPVDKSNTSRYRALWSSR